jgi:hypothetical protein
LDFSFPKYATTNEIEAIVECGMDAMFDAMDSGKEPDVAFFHEGSEVEKKANISKNTSCKSDDDADDIVDEVKKI